jgi:hypothetical protein
MRLAEITVPALAAIIIHSRMKDVWIGLVGVGPLPGNTCLGDAKGAYLNALALVSTSEEYRDAVTDWLRQLALFPFEFDDIERFDDRLAREELGDELCALAAKTRRSGRVTFDRFQRFRNLDG